MTTSIIVPTHNRAHPLTRTLASIAGLDTHPGDFEVLVVDNASEDHTRHVVDTARDRWPRIDWRYLHEPMPGLLSGRHRGAHEAQGSICAFIDDDVWLSRDWLNGLEEAFARGDVALVGGPSRPLFRAAVPEWLDSFYWETPEARFCGWLSLVDAGSAAKEIDPLSVFGLNFSIRASTLRELGGFNPDCIPKALQRYQGDGESGLSEKIMRSGRKAFYHPAVAVEHEVPPHRLTIEYFEQRAYYNGVCGSFRELRDARSPQPAAHTSDAAAPQAGFVRQAVRSMRQFVREVAAKLPSRPAFPELHARTRAAQEAGYAFHQAEVQRDPALLQWVLKSDYWDYTLPTGWERFVSHAAPVAT